MSDQPDRLDIHGVFNQLTLTHTHRETYTAELITGTRWTRAHLTSVPSLIHQLQHATPASTGEPGAGGYASRPAAHLEALDTLIRIDLEASRWIRDLGEDDPGDTTACLTRLHALHASTHRCPRTAAHRDQTNAVDCCAWHAIDVDARRWWTQARIVTGWDSPAWRPDNTCPICGTRGTLRVRLAHHAAMCIDCRTTWDPNAIGLLADHIRWENAEDDTTDEPDPDAADPRLAEGA